MTHQVESENQSFGESHTNIHHDPMTKEEEESKEPHTTEVGISNHVRGGARNFTGYVASTKVAKSGTRGGFVLARVCSYCAGVNILPAIYTIGRIYGTLPPYALRLL